MRVDGNELISFGLEAYSDCGCWLFGTRLRMRWTS